MSVPGRVLRTRPNWAGISRYFLIVSQPMCRWCSILRIGQCSDQYRAVQVVVRIPAKSNSIPEPQARRETAGAAEDQRRKRRSGRRQRTSRSACQPGAGAENPIQQGGTLWDGEFSVPIGRPCRISTSGGNGRRGAETPGPQSQRPSRPSRLFPPLVLRWSSAAPAVSLRGGGNEGLIASKRLRGTGLLNDDSIASRDRKS